MSSRRLSLDRYKVKTDPLRTERMVELAVLILLLVLCLQLLYSGARLAAVSMPPAVAPAQDALLVKELLNGNPVTRSQSDEIKARPLFWESRRPLEAQAAVVVEDAGQRKAGKLKGIKLLGVFGGGDTVGIIVQEKDKKRRILLGEEISGWTVDTVDSNEVVFAANGRTETLQLRRGTITASPSPSAPQAGVSSPVKKTARPTAGPAPVSGNGGSDELSLGGGRRK